MPKTVITLPCTAQDLESALHAVCDHHGLWNGRIDTMCDGSDSGDACVSIVLSEEVSGESSPSPSTPAPTSSAPTDSAEPRKALARMLDWMEKHAGVFYVQVSPRKDNPDEVEKERDEAIACARAALNKPLRNCDLYGGDYKMLHTAWFDWTGSPSGHNADGTVKLTYGEWLLVLASKKGGMV